MGSMTPAQLQGIVESARVFLVTRLTKSLPPQDWPETGTPEEIIDRHLVPDHQVGQLTLANVLARLLESAQNRQDANRVIIGSVEGGINGLQHLLLEFDSRAILAKWSTPEAVFEHIRCSGLVTGQLRTGRRSRWPQFCRSVLSAAKFVYLLDPGLRGNSPTL